MQRLPQIAAQGTPQAESVGQAVLPLVGTHGARVSNRVSPTGWWAGALHLGLGLFGAGIAASMGLWLAQPRSLSASELPAGGDHDGDGLFNTQELIFGTDPLHSDTDRDGFVDLVELARQSDPVLANSQPPVASAPSVGLATVSDGTTVLLTTAIYVPGDHQGGIGLSFGLAFNGLNLSIPFQTLAPISLIESQLVAGDSGLVFKVSTPIPDAFLQSLGKSSIYAIVGPPSGGPAFSAAVVNLQTQGGILTQSRQTSQGTGPQGLIYQPIVPPANLPMEYQKDKICQQLTIPVGQSGAIQILLVESSECQPSPGYCIPGCANEVGNTLEVIDPVALIGG